MRTHRLADAIKLIFDYTRRTPAPSIQACAPTCGDFRVTREDCSLARLRLVSKTLCPLSQSGAVQQAHISSDHILGILMLPYIVVRYIDSVPGQPFGPFARLSICAAMPCLLAAPPVHGTMCFHAIRFRYNRRGVVPKTEPCLTAPAIATRGARKSFLGGRS